MSLWGILRGFRLTVGAYFLSLSFFRDKLFVRVLRVY
jgi:hypothetical protein